MDLVSTIRTRRSIRAFQDDAIPEEQLRELVELANWAPSAGNLQARDFIIVRDPAGKRALAQAADQDLLEHAPAVLVVCANAARVGKYGRRGRELYMIQDAAAATENFLLAAHQGGLGTVWVGAFNEELVRRTLRLPHDVRPVTLVPIGRPAETADVSNRLPIEEVLHWEHW